MIFSWSLWRLGIAVEGDREKKEDKSKSIFKMNRGGRATRSNLNKSFVPGGVISTFTGSTQNQTAQPVPTPAQQLPTVSFTNYVCVLFSFFPVLRSDSVYRKFAFPFYTIMNLFEKCLLICKIFLFVNWKFKTLPKLKHCSIPSGISPLTKILYQ